MNINVRLMFFFTLLTAAACLEPCLAEEVKIVQLGVPVNVEVKTLAPGTTKEQRDRYTKRSSELEEHDLAVETRAASVPFANVYSSSAQRIKPNTESLLNDGIEILGKLEASAIGKVKHSFVSTVAEPSSAMSGKNILITYNWGALWSSDSGASFKSLDPFSLFDNDIGDHNDGFCCDQLSYYDRSSRTFFWLLQGSAGTHGNKARLLFANEADFLEGQSPRWKAFDFSPVTVGKWNDEWFDFPDMATTTKFLYITFNSFSVEKPGEEAAFTRAVVLRIPLNSFKSTSPVTMESFSTIGEQYFSPRLSQGAAARMYWATHNDTAHLAVRWWEDDQPEPASLKLLRVDKYKTPAGNSVGPNGKPWLKRLDDRITASWTSKDRVGFAWSSDAIPEAPNTAAYPLPHVRVAIVREADLNDATKSEVRATAQPHIWSRRFAIAYPAAAPNGNGDVGFAIEFGGAKDYPGGAVGTIRGREADWRTTFTVLTQGKNTPRCRASADDQDAKSDDNCGKWGDYINVRADADDPSAWYVAEPAEVDSGKKREDPSVAIVFAPFRVKQSTLAGSSK